MKHLVSILLFVTIAFNVQAQFTPATNAVQLPDSIVFAGTTTIANASITWHPVQKKYYTLRIGNSTFPLQTFSETFTCLRQDTAGIDTRGIWYNPNTNQMERNCFSSLGWATINLNGSGHAINTFTSLFTGMNQPTSQSVGTYDFKTNTVLFYNTGMVHIYDRNTATPLSPLVLSGTAFTNVNTESVIYTGQIGFEIGLLDYVSKKILLFNRSTGVLSASVQLPATALTHNQFRFCYANDRVWLFNSSLKKWNAYSIWNQPLPVELSFFKAIPVENERVRCSWATATEIDNDYFTVEKSGDGGEFEEVGRVTGAGNSSQMISYDFTDSHPFPGVSYYRLKQTDFNGQFTYSRVVAVSVDRNTVTSSLLVYPNPATDHVTWRIPEDCAGPYEWTLIDARGNAVFTTSGVAGEMQKDMYIFLNTITPGLFTVRCTIQNKIITGKIIIR